MAEILKKAKEGNYGVTAPNIQNEAYIRAVVDVAERLRAPMIIDINTWVHPDIPWAAIRGMRNRIVHNYGIVSMTIVYDTVVNHIPKMYAMLKEIYDAK